MVALFPAIIGLGFFIGYVFLFLPLDTRGEETSDFMSQAMLEYHEASILEVLAPNDTVSGTGAAVIHSQVHPAIPNIADFRTAHYLVTSGIAEEDRTVVILTWADPDLVGAEEDVLRMIRMLSQGLRNDPLQIDAGFYGVSGDVATGELSEGIVGDLTFADVALGELEILGVPAIVSLHPR
jgi:hypothetical protein